MVCYDTRGATQGNRPQLPPMIHSGAFEVRRSADEVFDLLANPERFGPLMPDFESMAVQDATHFTLRTVIQVGQISGHANLAMELCDAVRPGSVGYSGAATLAGSPLSLKLDFVVTSVDAATEISWRGEVTLGGSLALLAGSLMDTMGRQSFERMAARLRESLREQAAFPAEERTGDAVPEPPDYEI